ncbi:MAG: metallo-beta-lactamase [Gemmatimonadetes bacterium]|nr:metallo-beta-lactamase [Gemmatimonadota bacterium]
MTSDAALPAPVTRDVWRIRTPLPFRPREVHAYLARLDAGRWMLVDGGLGTEDAWAALDAGVRAAAGGWAPVALHVVTHMHVDHVGLAARVVDACGARVAMGALDARRMAHAAAEPAEEAEHRAGLMRRAGVPREVLDGLEGMRREMSAAAPPVCVDDELEGEAGDVPGAPGWRWVWTPGHTAGHVALLRAADGVMLSGDAVLPRVQPTVGVNRQRADPVGDALWMLGRVEALRPAVVLGGHGDPIDDPPGRIAELRAGYADESAAFHALLGAEPAAAWALGERRRPGRELPDGVRIQLVRETLAHLQRLAALGLAREEPLADGAAGWTRADAPPPR